MGSWEGEIACWCTSKCDILWLKTVWECFSFTDFMTGDAGCWSGLPSVRFIAPTASSIPSVFGLGPAWFDTTKQYQPGVLPQQLEDGVVKQVADLDCYIPNTHRLQESKLLTLHSCAFICILILRYQFIHTLLYASIILFISIYHFVSRIWCEVEKNYVPLHQKSAYPSHDTTPVPDSGGKPGPRGFFADKNSKKGP